MESGFELKEALSGILGSLSHSIASFAPRFLTAIVLVILGMAIALLIRRTLRGSLQRVRFDALLEKLGMTAMFQRIGILRPPSVALSQLVYFLLVILVLQTAFQAVGLVTIANAISAFFSYLPNLVAALIVLLLGNTIGQFAGRAVEQAAGESGVDFAAVLGRVVTSVVLFVVIIMAVSQLQIDTDLIQRVAVVFLAGFALSFALTFGLGTREITRNIVAGFYARKLFNPGEELELQGQRGVLRAITPIQTIIELEDGIIAVSNQVFLNEKVKQ